MRGALGPLAASSPKPSAVCFIRVAVERGIEIAPRAALRAARSGVAIRFVAARTNSISGLGSSGSQRSSGSSISVPSLFGSRMIVPTSIAATPSTSAWWVFGTTAKRLRSSPSTR